MSLGADEILSLIILLVALYIFYKALRYNWRRWNFFNHCEVTKAQVIQKNLKALSSDSRAFDEKSLRFVNNKGQLVVYKTRWIGKSDKGQELHSDGVEIIYDPDNPSDIRINNFFLIWFWPLFWLAVTFLFFMTSLHRSIDNGALDDLVTPFIKYAKVKQEYAALEQAFQIQDCFALNTQDSQRLAARYFIAKHNGKNLKRS